MPTRFQTGLSLTKNSLGLIKQNKRFLIPLAVGTLLITGCFLLVLTPIINVEKHAIKLHTVSTSTYYITFGALLLFFFVSHVLTMFSHTAVTASVIRYIKGQPCDVKLGLKVAIKRIPTIFSWVIIMTTVGIYVVIAEKWVDHWHEKRSVKNKLSGLIWLMSTFFVVPVLAEEKMTAVQSIKHASELMKDKWGELVAAPAGMSVIFFLAKMIALLPIIITAIIGGKSVVLVGGAISIGLFILVSVFHAATFIGINSALYLYATGDTHINKFFDPTLLKNAFRHMKKRPYE